MEDLWLQADGNGFPPCPYNAPAQGLPSLPGLISPVPPSSRVGPGSEEIRMGAGLVKRGGACGERRFVKRGGVWIERRGLGREAAPCTERRSYSERELHPPSLSPS